MKRTMLLGTALLLAIGLTSLAYADRDDERDAQPYGPRYGMGLGPGGMGYGMGPGQGGDEDGEAGYGAMGWRMRGLMAQLPAEKREQLRAMHFAMQRQMIAKRAEMAQARLALAEALDAFPLDQKAAQAAFGKLNQFRKEAFELRLAMMAQTQQIVGKELWEQMHSGFGPGMAPGGGYGAGMAPGRMGPPPGSR